MARRQRRTHSATFKAQVAVAPLRREAVQHFVCKLSSLGQLTGGLLSPLLGSGRFFQAAIRH